MIKSQLASSVCLLKTFLGGGLIHVVFLPLLGEMIHIFPMIFQIG